GLESCDWFLIVMSPRAAESRWVKTEVRWAFRKRSGSILPVLYQPCDPEDFHLMMPDVQYIDFTVDISAARSRLIEVIRCALAGARIKQPASKPLEPIDSEETSRGVVKSAAKEFINSIGMRFVLIPAGTFRMGSPLNDPDAEADERPHHGVTIS